MPRIRALTATVANMERVADIPGVFCYDRSTGERWSANPADYFAGDPLSQQADGRQMILARERCEIVPVLP